MLSRTADHLFWLSRYMERAENTARMLDINYQTSLMPQTAALAEQGWGGILSISELTSSYEARYGAINARHVKAYIVKDESNPSSIINCLRAARENARAVRGTLTTEVWETNNQTWLEFQDLLKGGLLERDPSELFEWVKLRSHLSRGVAVGTMLQDEALDFMRIGSMLERADNTARLLDVKFHAVEATATTARDFYHWSAILRSVSAFEIYRKVYSNVILPEKVADLMILRANLPRSLAYSMGRLVSSLKRVGNSQSGETQRLAGRLHAELMYGRIDEILAAGLHDFLIQFLARVGELGAGISRDFLMPESA